MKRVIDDRTGSALPASTVCVLCGRIIPQHARASRHHLVPKLRGGARGDAPMLHQVCHAAIHARFSEAELARYFSDPVALRDDPDLRRFIAWVSRKPDDFHAPTRRSRHKKGPHRGRGA
ncbi:hypothetical protein [Neoasaia chiangmaiensis]|uniref:hypothetical protein n=1 Tax=Neoasaia chiangmaiensis TaxID=320497 RepID=UPI001FE6E580|nr:hypothetical protein [Neoasaia chiangmaiensis]